MYIMYNIIILPYTYSWISIVDEIMVFKIVIKINSFFLNLEVDFVCESKYQYVFLCINLFILLLIFNKIFYFPKIILVYPQRY